MQAHRLCVSLHDNRRRRYLQFQQRQALPPAQALGQQAWEGIQDPAGKEAVAVVMSTAYPFSACCCATCYS